MTAGAAMSVNARILLFAATATVITCVLSVTTLMGARTGRRVRERVVASQDQVDGLSRLNDGVWPFLNALSRAHEKGQDTTFVLKVRQGLVLAEQAEFHRRATLEEEMMGAAEEPGLRPQELEQFDEAIQAVLRWMERTEQRLRSEPAQVPLPPRLEWELYQDYETEAGLGVSTVGEAEREELRRLRRQWDANAHRVQLIATTMGLGSIVLMVGLAFFIFVPLRGSLRKLRTAAQRVGQGDFEVALPEMGKDELGLLASAMNRMARELRGILQEKQRLLKAEAEVSEREARRYSAMLEETVLARTRQLEETQQQLLFADRLATVGRLAAGVAHEINNPLSYMLSNLNFIHKELSRAEAGALPESKELLDATTEAREGAEHVRVIVQELKMLARPDDVALGPVELEGVVHGAAKIAAQELRGRARLVEQCRGVPMVRGNGQRLGQVVLNLLLNAAHAIELGNEDAQEVRVVARVAQPGSVVLEVSDTGSGIPAENLERIFEPFFTTKPVGVGTGLGLSVCRNLVHSMGGTIQVESQVGRGTTFRITLPTMETSS
jgi:two-component system NtrC family sensor kinase